MYPLTLKSHCLKKWSSWGDPMDAAVEVAAEELA
jgi:hypothetical protein